jgi:glutamine synthetase
MAFTGNKFEFRAVGASQSCSGSNVVLNTIMAEALDEICAPLEKAVAAGKDFNETLQVLLQGIVRKHKRILFDGDNYSAEWRAEAARRGLPNLMKTPEALKAIIDPRSVALFTRFNVLSERELKSRYEVYMHSYHLTVTVEARCALTIAKTMIAPAVVGYQKELADAIKAVKGSGGGAMGGARKVLVSITKHAEAMYAAIAKLEKAADKHSASAMLDGMTELRKAVDELESVTPDNRWPLPSYAQMMFMM